VLSAKRAGASIAGILVDDHAVGLPPAAAIDR